MPWDLWLLCILGAAFFGWLFMQAVDLEEKISDRLVIRHQRRPDRYPIMLYHPGYRILSLPYDQDQEAS